MKLNLYIEPTNKDVVLTKLKSLKDSGMILDFQTADTEDESMNLFSLNEQLNMVLSNSYTGMYLSLDEFLSAKANVILNCFDTVELFVKAVKKHNWKFASFLVKNNPSLIKKCDYAGLLLMQNVNQRCNKDASEIFRTLLINGVDIFKEFHHTCIFYQAMHHKNIGFLKMIVDYSDLSKAPKAYPHLPREAAYLKLLIKGKYPFYELKSKTFMSRYVRDLKFKTNLKLLEKNGVDLECMKEYLHKRNIEF